ncbi:MAG: hypothetical protein B7Y45_07720 [Sphingomonas sp. 28-66-16]|nr:MAG: hypothetical protein B7Y45_07720 [Sphingomonas sp. 28-66-16]
MVDSIVNTLGAGSGIDTVSLVNQLVDAQFAAKKNTLAKQNQTLSSQISGVATLKSAITDLATGLKTLATGGAVSTSATSSNPGVVKAEALAGAKLSGLSATLEVRQLAQSQSVATAPVADRSAAVGTGTLTLTFGTATTANGALTGFTAGSAAPIDIAIDAANASLDQIAAAINAKNAGVTASVITDADGARLALKGKTGADQAFTLTATEDPGAPGLAALTVGVGSSGTTVGTGAQDAIVAVDGIALKRSTNSISDLVDGVKLDLVSAAPGTIVNLGSSVPTDQLRSSVNDLVAALNSLQSVVKAQTSASGGPLFNDSAAKTLQQSLRRFTLTPLATSTTAGAPTTLADIGIGTNRDGSLSVNADRLTAVLNAYPDAVEALFRNGTGATGGGVSAAFQAIADAATNTTYGLGASETRYTKAQSAIADAQTKADADKEVVRARLTRQFSGADARVAAYKATQSFLTQQFAPKPTN